MQHEKVKLIALLLLCMGITSLKAQETIPASGGNATGLGGTVSYTVGQVVYTTNAGTSGSIAQGVQQPFEISVVTGIDEFKGIQLVCSAYPNPTTSFVVLKIEGEINPQFNVSLFDLTGKMLLTQKVVSDETSFDLENYVTGSYFLRISENTTEIKTFKIVKK